MKRCIIKMSGGLCLLAITAGSAVTHAETIGGIVQRQKEIANLDHQIERNARLLELKEQQEEMSGLGKKNKPEPKQRAQGNTQVEYFGQQGAPGAQGQDANGQPISLRKPEKSDEEKRKERVLAVLDDAALAEAYVPKDNPNAGMIGVINVSNRSFEVRKSSVIEGWEAVSVELDRVVFENEEFEVRKTVFQAR